MAHSLYITSTLRHLLIAVALAARAERGRSNHLVIVSHEPTDVVQRYIDLLRDWPDAPFETAEIADADFRRGLREVPRTLHPLVRPLAKRRMRRGTRQLLRERITAWRPDRVLVGADDYFETEYALYLSQRLNPQARGIYLEDGSVAYERSYRRRDPIRWIALGHAKTLIKKITFGPWFEFVPVTGTHSRIGAAWVAFPDLVIPELRSRELHALTPEIMRSPAPVEFARRALHAFGVDVDRLCRASVLIMLAHSLVTRPLPRYERTMRDLCARLLEAGETVAVKYHPRELEPDWLGLEGHPGLHLLPRNVILEHLLLAADMSAELTVIAPSTALLATRWLQPDARVIAIAHPGDRNAAVAGYLQEHCQALGITIEREPERIVEKYFGRSSLAPVADAV